MRVMRRDAKLGSGRGKDGCWVNRELTDTGLFRHGKNALSTRRPEDASAPKLVTSPPARESDKKFQRAEATLPSPRQRRRALPTSHHRVVRPYHVRHERFLLRRRASRPREVCACRLTKPPGHSAPLCRAPHRAGRALSDRETADRHALATLARACVRRADILPHELTFPPRASHHHHSRG